MVINIGDKVVVNLDYDHEIKKGMTGIYHGKDPGGCGREVVEFDKFQNGHTGSGTVPHSNSCWFIDLKFLTNASEPMVGDRVECIKEFSHSIPITVGMQGELKKILSTNQVTVKWDNYKGGHDGSIEPGSFAYLHVYREYIKKVGEIIPEPEPEKPFFNIFDTSDIFKPEVINRIWESTMGRPVEYPKLPPLPPEKDEPEKLRMEDVKLIDGELVVGEEAICVESGSNLNYCDRGTYLGMFDGYARFRMTYTSSVHPVGKEISCYPRRFKHFRMKDEYFFSKPKKYTREMIDRMWEATQELSRH